MQPVRRMGTYNAALQRTAAAYSLGGVSDRPSCELQKVRQLARSTLSKIGAHSRGSAPSRHSDRWTQGACRRTGETVPSHRSEDVGSVFIPCMTVLLHNVSCQQLFNVERYNVSGRW